MATSKKRNSEELNCELNNKNGDKSPSHSDQVSGEPASKIAKVDCETDVIIVEPENTSILEVDLTNCEENSIFTEKSVIIINDFEQKMTVEESRNVITIDSDESKEMLVGIEVVDVGPPADISGLDNLVVIDEVNETVIEDIEQKMPVEESPNVITIDSDESKEMLVDSIEGVDVDVGLSADISGLDDLVVIDEVHETIIEDGEVLDTITQGENSNSSEKPCITINFSNDSTLSTYRNEFEKFLCKFIEFEVSFVDLSIQIKKNEAEKTSKESGSPKKRKKKKAQKELFVVDTQPSISTRETQMRYASKFTLEKSGNNEEKMERKGLSAQTCFNCNESHALKDCNLPKDYNKINAARQKFLNSKTKSLRYHLDDEQKYGHIVPGRISDSLRKALGLQKQETPAYIYGMRILGYPPGWLEEAKIVHSNLSMFDIDGNNVRDRAKKNFGLNSEKVVEYPGFNVPFEKGYKDDYRNFNVPPFSKQFCKDEMIKYFDKQSAAAEDDFEIQDMDLDENFEKQTKVDSLKSNNVSSSRDSPSLTDLEKQKKVLLEQLEDPPKTADNKCETEIDTSLENEMVQTKASLNNSTLLKDSTFGTPILKSCSPYSRLPNPDNFTIGVSPVIDFENLPNSTGKYEQMNGVLQKVRTTLKTIQTKS